MPVRVSFPAPSMWVCPLCDGPLDGPACPHCGAAFTTADGRTLWKVDHDLHDLSRIRNDVATRLLLTGAREPAGPVATIGAEVGPSPTGWSVAQSTAPPSGFGPPPRGPVPPAPPTPPRPTGSAPGGSWSAAEVLVATGALSLVAAVTVFAAVAWDDLGGAAKAAVLLGLTALTAALAGAAERRGLRATAEAVGLVAVTLGVADVQVARVALDGSVAAPVVWATGLGLLAAGAIAAGRAMRLRAVAAAGVALAFLPAVVLTASESAVAVAVALGALALAAIAVDGGLRLDPLERVVLRVGGALAWAAAAVGVATGDALVRLVDTDGASAELVVGPVAVLLGLSLVAVAGALAGRWTRTAHGLVLGVAAGPALIGVLVAAIAGGASAGGVVAWVLGAAALVVVVGLEAARVDRSRPWVALAVLPGVVVTALSVVPAVAVLLAAGDLLEEGVQAIEAGRSVGLDAAVGMGEDRWWVGAATIVQLLAVVATGVAWTRRAGSSDGGRLAVASAVVGLAVVVPVVTAVPIGVAVGVTLLAVLGAASLRLWRPATPIVTGLGLGLAGVATLLALPSAPLVVLTTVAVAALAVLLAADALDRTSPSAAVWAGGTAAVVVGGVVLDAVRLGGHGPVLVAATVGAALVVAAVAPALERWGGGGRTRPALGGVVDAVDVVAVAGFGVALALTQTVDQASAVIAVAGVVAGLSALRPTRPLAWVASVAAAVVVTWLQLGDAGVEVVEAYTLPLALGLLVAAGWGWAPPGSWDRFGPGLAVALGPTTLLALDGGDLTRTVVALVAGAIVTIWGATARLQAPLAIGAAVVGAIAVRNLAPVATDLPRYLVLAVVGVVLLAVGATFEQRKADLRHARQAFGQLA